MRRCHEIEPSCTKSPLDLAEEKARSAERMGHAGRVREGGGDAGTKREGGKNGEEVGRGGRRRADRNMAHCLRNRREREKR